MVENAIFSLLLLLILQILDHCNFVLAADDDEEGNSIAYGCMGAVTAAVIFFYFCYTSWRKKQALLFPQTNNNNNNNTPPTSNNNNNDVFPPPLQSSLIPSAHPQRHHHFYPPSSQALTKQLLKLQKGHSSTTTGDDRVNHWLGDQNNNNRSGSDNDGNNHPPNIISSNNNASAAAAATASADVHLNGHHYHLSTNNFQNRFSSGSSGVIIDFFRGTSSLWKSDPSASQNIPAKFSKIPSRLQIFQQIQRTFSRTISNRAWIGQGHDAIRRGQKYDSFQVINVWHVENTKSWQRYVMKREAISQQASHPKLYPVVKGLEWASQLMEMRSDVNEFLLFHGSSRDACLNIANKDFNAAFTNPASLFGKACAYLSENSNKSDEYSEPPDTNNNHWMLLCRVTLGTPHIAKTALNRIEQCPCVNNNHHVVGPSNPTSCQRCGSNLANCVIGVPNVTQINSHVKLSKHREFAIYDPDQIYVEFLVEYKRTQNLVNNNHNVSNIY